MQQIWAAPSDPVYAFAGAVMSTGGATALCDSFTVRRANGFSQSNAMNAAIKSHTIMAQNTLFQEPVLANNQAAPGPANAAANPLAV
jgi:hypothetical protein